MKKPVVSVPCPACAVLPTARSTMLYHRVMCQNPACDQQPGILLYKLGHGHGPDFGTLADAIRVWDSWSSSGATGRRG